MEPNVLVQVSDQIVLGGSLGKRGEGYSPSKIRLKRTGTPALQAYLGGDCFMNFKRSTNYFLYALTGHLQRKT